MMDMLIGGMMGDKLRKMRDLTENQSPKATPAPKAVGAAEPEKQTGTSMGDRIADDVRRDLEKMEQKRAEKEARKQQKPPSS
jgi:hypothetical protein